MVTSNDSFDAEAIRGAYQDLIELDPLFKIYMELDDTTFRMAMLLWVNRLAQDVRAVHDIACNRG